MVVVRQVLLISIGRDLQLLQSSKISKYWSKRRAWNCLLSLNEPISSFTRNISQLQGTSIGMFKDSPSKTVTLTSSNSESEAKRGAEILRGGGVIGIPTDTVYGLAADIQNPEALTRIYSIKGRNSTKPIAICVSRSSSIYTWAQLTVPKSLLQDVFPGPITLVFHRTGNLTSRLNPNTSLIGIRIPDHQFIRQVVEALGNPIALTSANPSSTRSTLSTEEFEPLWPFLDFVFDGGRISGEGNTDDDEAARTGSTVIDLSNKGFFRVIRKGAAYSDYIKLFQEKYNLKEQFE